MSNGTAPAIPQFFAYQRDDSDPNNTTIIATGLTLTQELMPVGKNLFVYADELTISSPLTLTGYSASFAVRQLVCQGGSLDVSGGPPQPADSARAQDGGNGANGSGQGASGQNGSAGTDGASGTAGASAGSVTILAGSISGTFSVTANGGAGQGGQAAGNGGAGGDGTDGAEFSANGATLNHQGEPGGAAGSGGNGGKGGRGGSGGNGGNVTVNTVDSSSGNVTATMNGAGGGSGGTGGFPGLPGTPGVGGQNATHDEWGAQYGGVNQWNPNGTYASSGAGGSAGTYVGSYGNGSTGSNGTLTPTSSTSPSAFIPTSNSVNALTQCSLMLREAELDFLNSDYTDANTLLTWLIGVTPASSSTAPSDNATEWVQLNTRVQTLLAYMQAGLDFYGQSRDHVPLANLNFYQSEAGTLTTIAQAIESAYNTYQQEASDQQTRIAQLQSVQSQASDHITSLGKQQTTAENEQNAAQNAAASLYQSMQTQQAVVNSAAQAVNVALSEMAANCSTADIVSAMVSLFFLSVDAYSALDELQELYKTFNTDSSTASDIVKLLVPMGDTTLYDIQTQYGNLKPYLSNGPDYFKLTGQLTDRQGYLATFDSNIQQYIGSSDPNVSAEASNFKTQVHTYADLVQAHNQKIFEYTAAVLKYNYVTAVIAHKQSELTRVGNQIADDINPTLPEFLTFTQGAYQDVLSEMARYVFNENAAYSYWSLQPNTITFSDQDVAGLASAYASLMSDIETTTNSSDTPRQPFQGVTFNFTPSEYPSEFQSFQTGAKDPSSGDILHQFSFSIPLDAGPFEGWYQVIANNFTITVSGATMPSSNNVLDVYLVHSGRALFYDSTGNNVVEFSHESTVNEYKYNIGGSAIGGGALGGDANNPTFIGVSPCTVWTVVIPESYNTGLSLSNASEIVVTFDGLYFPLPPDARK